MPSFTFVLPHWVYWGTLLLFPFVAMYMVARQRRLGAPREPILFNAYLFWVTSGFMGLHRMYLKSWWGFLYLPFFVAVLYCNGEVREAARTSRAPRPSSSRRRRAVKVAEPIDAAAPTAEESKALAEAQAAVRKQQAEYDVAFGVQNHWKSIAGWIAVVVAAMLLVDAFLLPGLVRRRRANAEAAGYADRPGDARARRAGARHGRGSDDPHAHAIHRLDRRASTARSASTSPTGPCSRCSPTTTRWWRASSSIRRPTGCTKACS